MEIMVYVDESGTIPHAKDNSKCFVIAMLFTDNPEFLKKVFKKERMKIAKKNEKLMNLLRKNREIKGSELTEKQKVSIYSKISEKCLGNLEIGIILLNLQTCNDRMRQNSARTFNFLIKRYLETHFKSYSKFKDAKNVNFVIDERNIATGSKYTLEEYLNTSLNMTEQFTEDDMAVKYSDSQSYLLLQLVDIIANTYFRHHHKNIAESAENVKLLKKTLCRTSEYRFPL